MFRWSLWLTDGFGFGRLCLWPLPADTGEDVVAEVILFERYSYAFHDCDCRDVLSVESQGIQTGCNLLP